MTTLVRAGFLPHRTMFAVGIPAGNSAWSERRDRIQRIPVIGSARPIDPDYLGRSQVRVVGSRSESVGVASPVGNLGEQLFDALVSLKVAVSRYAMHIPQDVRERLFGQLDDVLAVEDWHDDDALPQRASFLD